MQKKPFFSIVIPTYNREELIFLSIQSVMNQTFSDWELIIADDCSTDNTEQKIKELGNEKIKFVSNEVNKGNAGARNLGIKNSNGQYVCFLDSDDQFHDNFLVKMHELILKSDFPGFLWCNVNWIDIDGNILDHSIPDTWEPLKQEDPYLFFMNGLKFGTGYGFTVRKDCFDKTGYFDENLRTAVDTDFILRIVQDFNFNHTKEILADTYDHVGVRVRNDTSEKLKSYKILYSKHEEVIRSNKKLNAKWSYKLMWLCYHNKQKSNARRLLINSLKAGNNKALITSILFETLPVKKAIELHKKISEKI